MGLTKSLPRGGGPSLKYNPAQTAALHATAGGVGGAAGGRPGQAAFSSARVSSVPGAQLYVADTVVEGEPSALTARRYSSELLPSRASSTKAVPSFRKLVSRAIVSRTNGR